MKLNILTKQQFIIFTASVFLYVMLLLSAFSQDILWLKITALGIPFLLIIFYFAIYRPLIFASILVLSLPLSINLENTMYGIGLSIPGELLISLATILLLINLLKGTKLDARFLKHPLTLAIGINLLWMLVTTASSTMPIISLKYILIRVSYLLVFYLLFSILFGHIKGIQNMMLLYTATLILVIFFITLKHARFGFIQEVNAWAPKPFFKDHTIYGACIVMLLPFIISRLVLPKEHLVGPRFWSILILPVLLTGIFLSYSRATWLSIGVIIITFILILFKVRLKYMLGALGLIFLTLWFYRSPILHRLQEVNSQRGTDLKEHVSSVANIQSSASNVERINRWESAFAMFPEKPMMGFGPGTYPFQYAPYQKEKNLTRISTYFGDRGGVHSEYLKPLVESGIPGLISFIAIIFFTIHTALKLIYKSRQKTVRILAGSLLLGLATYYFHGFVNFFMDTDKAAMLFWSMSGLLVALDINEKDFTAKLLQSKQNTILNA